jgi:hypothetical protein
MDLKKTDHSISLERANVVSMIIVIPWIIISVGLYGAVYGFPDSAESLLDVPFWLLAILFLAGIVVHEGIHGLTWKLFATADSAEVEYGVMWKQMTPYAHIKGKSQCWAYRLGTVMPAVLMGILPFLIGLILARPLVYGFGVFFTLAAVGDFMILWTLRGVPRDALVEDHPSRAGAFVYLPEEDSVQHETPEQ